MRRLLALAALSFACSDPPAATTATLKAGPATLEVQAGGASIAWKRGDRTLARFDTTSFELGLVPSIDEGQSYDPVWLAQTPPMGLEWLKTTGFTLESATDRTATIRVAFPDETATLTLEVTADDRVRALLKPGEPIAGAIAYIRVRAKTDATEAYYGLGEWPDAVNHRGHSRPMQLEMDLGMESAMDRENHVPVPLLLGTRGWGVFVESIRVGLFDVATTAPDVVQITYGTGGASPAGLQFHLLAAAHPLDLTRHYYAITGAPKLPAPWALGPWIWRDENRDQAQVLDDLEQIRTLDLATSGYWIDRPYATAVNTFDFLPAQFPDPPAMIAALHAAGLRVALWHTPYVAEDATALRAEATQKGYFIPKTSISLNHWSTPLDFTAPGARAWWQGLIGRYTDLGIEGFKLDYAEDIQVGLAGGRNVWGFTDGSDERTQHWQYQHDYHRTYAEKLPENGGFLLCRAARWGEQKYAPIIWPGDMDAGFQRHGEVSNGKTHVGGFPATVIQGLSLGPSGFPFFGADTGGYIHSPPGREAWVRWFEQTALSPVMQVGNSASDTPWEANAENGRDAESLGWYRTYARLHLRLFPYEWTLANAIATTGRPIVRALGLAHPELGVHPDDTYLFGDALYVAPVVEAGKVTRDAILPAGAWVDWFDGTKYEGSAAGTKVTIPAPLGKLPLLLKAGGLVPLLRPTIDTLAPATREDTDSFVNDAGRIWVRVAPGPDRTELTVYDGTKVAQSPGSVELDATSATVFTKGAVFEIHQAATPAEVRDGTTLLTKAATLAEALQAAPAWTWTDEAGGLTQVVVATGRHTVTWR